MRGGCHHGQTAECRQRSDSGCGWRRAWRVPSDSGNRGTRHLLPGGGAGRWPDAGVVARLPFGFASVRAPDRSAVRRGPPARAGLSWIREQQRPRVEQERWKLRLYVRPSRRRHRTFSEGARCGSVLPLRFRFRRPGRLSHRGAASDWILGVIAQNGNAYEIGLGPGMQPAVKYWADRAGMEDTIRGALTLAATRAQHVDGAADPALVSPDSWTLDQYWLDTPGRAQIMLDLLYDYQSNVALYPTWQRWLREYQPPLLLPWGRNDKFFPEAGARAYLKDVPGAELHLLDGGDVLQV